MVKAAGIDELKKELQQLPPKKLMDLVLRLARFKKENKELLNYLLFEAGHPSGYIESLQIVIAEQMAELPGQRVAEQKKRLRRILKIISRHTKYIGSKEAQAELLQSFCQQFGKNFTSPNRASALIKIYDQQVRKITQLLPGLPEDLRSDYERWLKGSALL